MASIQPYKNPSGTVVWRVQFRVDSKGRQETFDNPKGAEEFGKLVDRVGGKAALEVLSRRRDNADNVPTLREWTERYLDPASGILTGIEPGTRKQYRANAEQFLPMLGDLPVDAISKTDVGRWVAWQEAQPSQRRTGLVAAKTVHNYHALLSNILKAAVEHGYRKDNPAYRTRLSRGQAREGVFLSREEFARIYAEIPTYYQPLIAFLVGSQARWSEATALEWADLNTDTTPPTVRITKAWKKSLEGSPVMGVPKSQKGRRTISLWPELVTLLGERSEGLLFKGRGGGQIWYGGFNTRVWRPAVLRSGISKTPNIHDLRHTGASWLIADGVPLPSIQNRLGHESITTTVGVYGHLNPDSHTRMSASLAASMGNVLPQFGNSVPARILISGEKD
jgi:integrase